MKKINISVLRAKVEPRQLKFDEVDTKDSSALQVFGTFKWFNLDILM